MTEPKRRGRPPKAKPCPECGQTGSHYDDCAVGMGAVNLGKLMPDALEAGKRLMEAAAPEAVKALAADIERDLLSAAAARIDAQAYALRVWRGQSVSADRPWRIQRVKEALAGQNLPFDGVELPE